MDITGVGDFLGCVRLTGRALNDFLGTTALAKAGKKSAAPKSFTLHKTMSLPEEKQRLVKGKLTMLAKDVTKRINRRQKTADGKGYVVDDDEEDVALSYLDAITSSAGEPHITVEVVSCTGLASTNSERPPEAFCRVSWDGNVIGATDTHSQSKDPVWSIETPTAVNRKKDGSGSFFRIHLSRRAEIMSSCNLVLAVYDRGNLLTEVSIGAVSLTFWSLLRLEGKMVQLFHVPFLINTVDLGSGGGIVTLPLKKLSSDTTNIGADTSNAAAGMLSRFADNIKTGLKDLSGMVKDVSSQSTSIRVTGTISFRVNFCFPIWEKSLPRIPSSFHRRVTIFSGKNLPEVNGSAPSCKVVVLYGGVVVTKSMVIPNSSAPLWPETICDLVVKFNSSTAVVIQASAVVISFSKPITDTCL